MKTYSRLLLWTLMVAAVAEFGLIMFQDAYTQTPQTPTLYYFSQSTGSDAAGCGTSATTPCQTLAKAQAMANTMSNACVTFQWKRGDVWHEQITYGAQVVATASTTLTNTPPVASGTASCPFTTTSYGTGAPPTIDAADPLTGTWTLYAGTTYRMAYSTADSSLLPCKLYMDHPASESVQVLMATNAVNENFNAAHTYRLGDITTDQHIHECWPPGSDPPSNTRVWSAPVNPFNTTSSGVTLVQAGVPSSPDTAYPSRWPAYPGVYYYDSVGQYLYLTLVDGSNPNSHTFEVTTLRHPRGILRQSVNYNVLSNLVIEHTLFDGIKDVAYSDSSYGYYTNEYNARNNVSVFNWGNPAQDNYQPQTGPPITILAGMMTAPGNEGTPHLLRNNYTFGYYVGKLDTYFSVNYIKTFGVLYSGSDAGGPLNLPLISNGTVNTGLGGCIDYETLTLQNTSQRNNGGGIGNNTCTGNQTGIYLTASIGGHSYRNLVLNEWGTGTQYGGCSQNTAANPQVFEYNILANIDNSIGGGLYNGFDGNSACPVTNVIIQFNTIVNVYAACVTMEGISGVGISGLTYRNNICDQRHNHFALTPTATNNSYGIYWARGVVQSATFNNNLWLLNNYYLTADSFSSFYGCPDYFTNQGGAGYLAWTDVNSKCIASPGVVGFNNYAANDFTLAPGSAAIGYGAGGVNVGAQGITGAVTTYAGQFSGRLNGSVR